MGFVISSLFYHFDHVSLVSSVGDETLGFEGKGIDGVPSGLVVSFIFLITYFFEHHEMEKDFMPSLEGHEEQRGC